MGWGEQETGRYGLGHPSPQTSVFLTAKEETEPCPQESGQILNKAG